MWRKMSKWHAPAFFLLVVVVVMGPLLAPGYILNFDLAWGPNYPVSDMANNLWPLHILITTLDNVIPAWLVQKLVLGAIIFAAGFGMYRFIRAQKFADASALIPYVAGLFYIFNPFFYDRFMAGQWLVMSGVALLPWVLLLLWRVFHESSIKRGIALGVVAGAMTILSIHTVMMLVIVVVVFGAFHLRKVKTWMLPGLVALGVWLVLNSLWLVPALGGTNQTTEQIDTYASSQLEAFKTNETIADNVPLSTLLLHGMWTETQGRSTLPAGSPLFWVGIIPLLAVIVIGGIAIIRRRDKLGVGLLIVGGVGWVLAMGVGWIGTSGLTHFLVEHVPFYGGYREPHKWLVLLVVLYGYALALGASVLMRRYKTHAGAIGFALLLLPIVMTPQLLFGASGQLRSVDYPSGWYALQAELNDRNIQGPILVMPWRMYLYADFAGRTVMNPARFFFSQSVISGNDPQIAGVSVVERGAVEQTVNTDILPNAAMIQDAGTLLKRVGVRYVILLKLADWEQYSWLNRQPDLNRVYENSDVILYEVK